MEDIDDLLWWDVDFSGDAADCGSAEIERKVKELLDSIDGYGPDLRVVKDMVDEAWDEAVKDAEKGMQEGMN